MGTRSFQTKHRILFFCVTVVLSLVVILWLNQRIAQAQQANRDESKDAKTQNQEILPNPALYIRIKFGNYFNNHNNHDFKATERTWVFEGKNLTYKSDRKDNRKYSLTPKEIEELTNYIQTKGLLQSLKKDVREKYCEKMGFGSSIVGNIRLENRKAAFSYTTNVSDIEKDGITEKYLGLEELFKQYVKKQEPDTRP